MNSCDVCAHNEAGFYNKYCLRCLVNTVLKQPKHKRAGLMAIWAERYGHDLDVLECAVIARYRVLKEQCSD